MALGIAEIIILGLLADWLVRKIKLPGLLGMLLLGIISGPYILNTLSPGILGVSHDLQVIALIVILLRAGFELSWKALTRVGGRIFLLSCVPVVFEAVAVTFAGPPLLGLSYMESAILGSILGAVSSAVVVPMMIEFMEHRKGVEKAIPTLLLASSSTNAVFVVLLYSILISLYIGGGRSLSWQLAGIPISIVSGVAVGLAVGWTLYRFFKKFNPRATKRVLIVLGVSIFLLKMEHALQKTVPFAALLAIMSLGVIILEKRERYAHEMSSKLGKIWILAELALFVMVGAQVDVGIAWKIGLAGAAVIAIGLVARSVGTYLCLLGSALNSEERLFVVVAYLPKATVQAAIGAAPLAAGMQAGPGGIILAVAVLSILLTAPAGAWAIAIAGEKWLERAPADKKFDAIDAAEKSE
jgi:NhaP-type Na+/H+ or K+/H+ antiporter